ncbi:molybdenum cofactor biosysynthesis protein [Micromonospora craterilacus]|uniref:Molybdenum cofactor biosysynthesis protein n=1 Tax=Micromonospora craterilacus TaxID=1655439 RepID=A0A2W2ELP6_9ACTN|nr:molybdenum cofactor biosysynthesis protein [Micromonospora craterilacus]PZG17679.1 molybdenum cofactor biosysynthesis protein [Micromonospora craterilacus]
MAEIVQLLASSAHRFVGRPADGPAPAPDGDLVDEIKLRAGLGIVGDRYFGKPAHREASVTVIAGEWLPPGAGLAQVRRNILTTGIAVDELVGSVLVLDSGLGPVRLRVHTPAHPCAWMDVTIGPGAWRGLRGHGGIRCTPVTDGILRVGPVDVMIERDPAQR